MRKTKDESELTKEKIIEAALYIFLEKGFSKTSVEDIVSSLGLTRGAFYWHFKDKDDLFKCIIEKEQSQRVASINSVTDKSLDEKTQLKLYLKNTIENFYDNERYRSFIKLRWFRIEDNPMKFSIPVTARMNETTISTITETLTSAKKNDLLEDYAAPKEIAFHLIAMTNGIYRLFFIGPEYYSKKSNVIKMVNNYIDLIFKK